MTCGVHLLTRSSNGRLEESSSHASTHALGRGPFAFHRGFAQGGRKASLSFLCGWPTFRREADSPWFVVGRSARQVDRRSFWSDQRGRNIQKTPSLSPSSACSPSRSRSPALRNSLGGRRGVIEVTCVWQISGLTGKARECFRLPPTHAPIFHDTSSTKREGSEVWKEVVTSASREVSNRPPNRTETELSRNRSVEDGELVRRETEFGDDEQSDGDEEGDLASKGTEVSCERGLVVKGGDER